MHTILCPTDFSTCADNAIAYANQLAMQVQGKLILLHTLFVPDAMPYAGMGIHPVATFGEEIQYQDRLIHICQELQEKFPQANVTYESKVGCMPVTNEITHIANQENADLIVMGTTGAHGLKEMVLGSTAADVIELSRRPVLVVPQNVTFSPIKRIVFAADLTEGHPADLTELVALAKLFDAEILFLHVLKENSFVKSSLARIQYSEIYSLADFQKVSFHTREETDIERGILQFSQEMNADLVVMINHQKSLWETIFSRSQTKKLAYHSPIPVLAIHN